LASICAGKYFARRKKISMADLKARSTNRELNKINARHFSGAELEVLLNS